MKRIMVLMLLAVLCGICFGASQGTYSVSATADAIQITVAADWTELVANSDDWNNAITLTANIDFGDGSTDIGGVGSVAVPFSGTFDGQGYTLSDFTEATPNTRDQVALFPYNSGTIKNLNVANPIITGSHNVGATSAHYASVIASENAYGGVVDNCTVVNATITGTQTEDYPAYYGPIAGANHGTVRNCSVIGGTIKADITATNILCLGGVVGFQTGGATAGQVGKTENCFSSIAISDLAGASDEPDDIDVGGVAGRFATITGHKNIISHCSHVGSISYTTQTHATVGGVVGLGYSSIYDSYHIGPITVVGTDILAVGGIVGYLNDSTPMSAIIDGCYSISDISVNDTASTHSHVGGAFGWVSSTAITTIISNCFAKGSLYDSNLGSSTLGFLNAGGFCGTQYRCTIKNSYCAMNLMTDGAAGITQGFIGSQSLTPILVSDCFWDSTTSGITTDTITGTTPKTTTELQTNTTYPGSWGFGTNWVFQSSGYPVPVSNYDISPSLGGSNKQTTIFGGGSIYGN